VRLEPAVTPGDQRASTLRKELDLRGLTCEDRKNAQRTEAVIDKFRGASTD